MVVVVMLVMIQSQKNNKKKPTHYNKVFAKRYASSPFLSRIYICTHVLRKKIFREKIGLHFPFLSS